MENKFIITAFILLFGAISLIGGVIYYTSPNIWLAGLLLILAGLAVDIAFGVIYFLSRPISGLHSPREHFRKGLRKGLIFAILIAVGLIMQIYFDLL